MVWLELLLIVRFLVVVLVVLVVLVVIVAEVKGAIFGIASEERKE